MNTCRFCHKPIAWTDGYVKYGARHYAHHVCYLDAGKPLAALAAWQVGRFAYRLLKERGLLDEAAALTGADEDALKAGAVRPVIRVDAP